MDGLLLRKWVTVTAVLHIVLTVMSTAPVPDGPVGLPSHIQVRTGVSHRNRAKSSGKRSQKPIIPPPQLEQSTKAELEQEKQLVKNMTEGYVNEEQQGVLQLSHPNYDQVSIKDLLPSYILMLPSNMMGATQYFMDTALAFTKLGLQSLFKSNVFKGIQCNSSSNEAELLICVTAAVERTSRIIKVGTNILSLNFRVLSGGATADHALSMLNTLAANPLNKTLMKALGSTAVIYITLMRESVPDETKVIAGSIMTELTGLPVASNIPDTTSGGFGRVNVIVPRPSRVHRADYDMAKLKAGATKMDLLTMNM
ncbi:hypothetical protein BgAZ_201940 [Babesia gibsoni]|uniref:Uncharacterized protein n=1 Tax=Babesia gibsoni TaxID=33632 RepID=A0AAD8LPI7_BABGI|nr:hypothetical protein BgAZ_201940 [Babesia gibsoni]